jgi:AcrR family transcriptional regulator
MSATDLKEQPGRPPRKRRSDGERRRQAILHEAARLATLEGIGGLSIGRLADAVGMSKSGLFAHFGSKQELQLATMEAASAIFTEQVLEPALQAPTAFERLRRLADNYLRYVAGEAFPGGCFFASVAAEVDTHPGPVRDVAVQVMHDWLALLERTVQEAQAEGDLDPAVDPAQLAFEVEASLYLANTLFVVIGGPVPIERARRSLEQRFGEVATTASPRV